MSTLSDELDDLITRKYSNFRGVDFRKSDSAYYRSPDSLNMWKSYKSSECIETRPGMKLLGEFSNPIYGLFFFTIEEYTHVLVHSGTSMLEWTNYPETPVETTELYTGLNPTESRYFIYDNTFFFMDGINYLEFDGVEMKEVEGTIPVTSYYKNPDGSTSIDDDTDTDLVYQDVNCLTNLRINKFFGDGESTDYQLDVESMDTVSTYIPTVTVDGVTMEYGTNFTVDSDNAIITFTEAPATDTEVVITYSKTADGYKERVLNCTLCCEFDNRIFFAGNPNYPNVIFHCELNDPRYIRDLAYYECGLDLAKIKAIMAGADVLWAIKETDQNSSSVYYLTPTIDSTYGKLYPSVNGNIAIGCVSRGLNFNDDLVFFSKRGLEAINSTSMYSEQILQHRSSLVDVKMAQESEYENVKLAEYNGYLMCLIDSKIYLADSRQVFTNNTNDNEYEWYYWELPNNIDYIREYRGKLYLGNASGQLFLLDGTDDNGEDIQSYWTTYQDDFGYPCYTKTTHKRGNVIDLPVMGNTEIKVSTIVDGVEKLKGTFSDEKGYIPVRIKDKKFKEIQLKFSSNKPFGVYSCTLQGFIASFVKR